jgi:hypothetical protein
VEKILRHITRLALRFAPRRSSVSLAGSTSGRTLKAHSPSTPSSARANVLHTSSSDVAVVRSQGDVFAAVEHRVPKRQARLAHAAGAKESDQASAGGEEAAHLL